MGVNINVFIEWDDLYPSINVYVGVLINTKIEMSRWTIVTFPVLRFLLYPTPNETILGGAGAYFDKEM